MTDFYTSVKRSHLISPFGVGAIMTTKNGVSVIICGLDEWNEEAGINSEMRQKNLAEFRLLDQRLSSLLKVSKFISPPLLSTDNEGSKWFVPTARFPLWEYCSNPHCRILIQRNPNSPSIEKCMKCSSEGKRIKSYSTQQVPIVLACSDGHISDVPWHSLIHYGSTKLKEQESDLPVDCIYDEDSKFKYKIESDPQAPTIKCEKCGNSTWIGEFLEKELSCLGERPWLPGSQSVSCDQVARIIQRTASNSYYPVVMSALYLPVGEEFDHNLIELLNNQNVKDILDDYTKEETIPQQDIERIRKIAFRRGIVVDFNKIKNHIDIYRAPTESSANEDVRSEELKALLSNKPNSSSNIGFSSLVTESIVFANKGDSLFVGPDRLFSRAQAIYRLAETRVLIGFSRIESKKLESSVGFEQQWGKSRNDMYDQNWLVADRTFGEGILILFEPEKLKKWEHSMRDVDQFYYKDLFLGVDATPKHYLVHSFAHAILREISTSSGYSLPSLRERLYVDCGEDKGESGVLVYVSESDEYGTLGGLIDLAQSVKLENMIKRALERTRWCGADPVCMNPPTSLQLKLTPGCCHNCLLVPETTCELMNKMLDRAFLIKGREGVNHYF